MCGTSAQTPTRAAGTHRVTAPEKILSIILVDMAAKEEAGREPRTLLLAQRHSCAGGRAGSGLKAETRARSGGTLGTESPAPGLPQRCPARSSPGPEPRAKQSEELAQGPQDRAGGKGRTHTSTLSEALPPNTQL